MIRCYEQDVEAPRVGCGCRQCYHARERSIDPRMLDLMSARSLDASRFMVTKPSTEIVHRGLVEYLSGRMDYASLHLNIIRALMELSDKKFEQTMEFVKRQPSPMFTVSKEDKP